MRALKTVAQTAIATIGTTALLSEVDWRVVASAALMAGLLSLLTSVAGLPEVTEAEELSRLSAARDDAGFFDSQKSAIP